MIPGLVPPAAQSTAGVRRQPNPDITKTRNKREPNADQVSMPSRRIPCQLGAFLAISAHSCHLGAAVTQLGVINDTAAVPGTGTRAEIICK